MIDTVKCVFSQYREHPTEPLLAALEDIRFTQKPDSSYYSGSLGGLSVKVYSDGGTVFFYGSLAKFHLGNNIASLGRAEVSQAIEYLEDIAHIPLGKAKLLRADVGATLTMKKATESYLPALEYLPRWEKVQLTAHSLRFSTKPIALIFYDKVREARQKGYALPELIKGQHLLRYEMQLKTKGSLGNVDYLEGLSSELIYTRLVQRWGDYYRAIIKQRKIIVNQEFIMKQSEKLTARAAEELLAVCTIQSWGLSAALEMIENAREIFTNDKALQRAKSRYKELANMPSLTMESESVLELDSKINQVLKHCR